MENGLPDFFEFTGEYVPKAHEKTDTVDPAELYAAAEETGVLNNRSAETATYIVENTSSLRLSSKISEEQETILSPETENTPGAEKTAEKSEVHKYPALLGTMTHKLMEMLVSSKTAQRPQVWSRRSCGNTVPPKPSHSKRI